MNLDDNKFNNNEFSDHKFNDNERLADQWLDVALKQYSSSEARLGLEERLLRNLRAEPASKLSWRAWAAGASVVAAILLLAAAFLIEGYHNQAEVMSEGAQHTIHSSIAEIRKPAALGHFKNDAGVTRSKSFNRPRQARSQSKAQPQWPSQFPSPQPLSEQEQLLARYVNERPKEARLLARATTELLEREMQAFEKSTPILKNSAPE